MAAGAGGDRREQAVGTYLDIAFLATSGGQQPTARPGEAPVRDASANLPAPAALACAYAGDIRVCGRPAEWRCGLCGDAACSAHATTKYHPWTVAL